MTSFLRQLLNSVLIIIVTMLVAYSCSSNQAGVGISVGNPTGPLPSASFSPNFVAALPEESIGGSSDASSVDTSFMAAEAPTAQYGSLFREGD